MSYCKGKSIEKQRGEAIKEVILDQRTVAQVARRYGRARSTIYRWLKKWQALNPHAGPFFFIFRHNTEASKL